ncbi:hypothetical protein [Streptomyces cinerochromogenes]|uniref:hypothetical protein n=1 Tax=Streptomyces cinerochromogenes TaxID=66422 RepID=UPI00166F8D46|nr:hypothetical protein [Streptomyces cinerochromogenes]GGS96533.1 hypothetical protein GCM10010206_69050 [Streptomyces cinerochromogenes]
MTRASGAEVRLWLAQAWPRAEAALVLAGGDVRASLADRPVLGEIFDDARLAELRHLATEGDFTDDICRCPGSLTVALLDARGLVIGSASLHGGTDLAWERGRFRNNLAVADPPGLRALLRRYGAHWL